MPYDYTLEPSFFHLVQRTQKGKIKILFNIKQVYNWNETKDGGKGCIDIRKEENYGDF